MESGLFRNTLRQDPLPGRDSSFHAQASQNTLATGQLNSAKNILQTTASGNDTALTDTATVCIRNPVADVNFRDSTNIVYNPELTVLQDFPFTIAAAGRKQYEKSRSELTLHLKDGQDLAQQVFIKDWYLPFLLLSFLVYGIVHGEILKLLKSLGKIFSVRGNSENVSREGGSLFQWQATIFNLAAFTSISIFLLLAAIWFEIVPSFVNQPRYSAIAFIIVISCVTLRHLVCNVVGFLSEEREVFEEYVFWVYQLYRLASMFLLAISIIILYSPAINPYMLFYTGFVIVAAIYFLRVTRLFLIFITRHISILYLILYLCALEILPVAVLIKYAGGIL
jgi:hypothetical protein